MCEIYFDGSAELISESRPTARKLHRCTECGGPIKPGQTYLRRCAKYDGDFSAMKACRACDRDMARFAEEHGLGWFSGGWIDFLEECVVDDGADADVRWKMMLVRADARRKAWAEAAHG